MEQLKLKQTSSIFMWNCLLPIGNRTNFFSKRIYFDGTSLWTFVAHRTLIQYSVHLDDKPKHAFSYIRDYSIYYLKILNFKNSRTGTWGNRSWSFKKSFAFNKRSKNKKKLNHKIDFHVISAIFITSFPMGAHGIIARSFPPEDHKFWHQMINCQNISVSWMKQRNCKKTIQYMNEMTTTSTTLKCPKNIKGVNGLLTLCYCQFVARFGQVLKKLYWKKLL